MMSATTRPNRPVASASAKPSRRLANCAGAADGLRKAPCRSLPKIAPMPTPAPTSAIEASPAPINFAADGSMSSLLRTMLRWNLVMHVKRVVEIDAGQDGEHIGLEERDQDFQPRER